MADRVSPSPPPASALPPAMREVTGFLVNRLAERLREVTMERIGSAALRPRQIGLLLVLRAEGRSQQQLLGERLGMDRTTTMHLVSALEAQGLLVREADPNDRRVNVLRLTSRGMKLAAKVDAQSQSAADEVLAALSPSESQTFHKLLVKVLTSQSETD